MGDGFLAAGDYEVTWKDFLISSVEMELQNELDEQEESIAETESEKMPEGEVGTVFLEQLRSRTDCSERLDHTNYRFLMWKALNKFPDRVEPRSRELSPLLLRFIR